MLSFNKKDYNVPHIAAESKLSSLHTKFEYRVYGLKQEENPLILISNPFIDEVRPLLRKLKLFFKKNGLQLEVEECEISRISVGLRYDIRKHVVLCASILKTVIYGLEDRLNLDQKFSIPGIPKFETLVKKKQEEPAAIQNQIELIPRVIDIPSSPLTNSAQSPNILDCAVNAYLNT